MRYPLYLALTVGVALSACSKSETSDSPAPPPPAPAAAANSGMSLTPTTPPPPANTPAPQNLTATPPAEAALMNGEVYGKGSDGNVLEGEALIKKALMQHVEGKGLPYPARIEELVEQGTLKALPPAPAGKKWAIDPATKKVVLI